MPRKKQLPKFRFTFRKKDKDGKPGTLFVRYKPAGVAYPIWRKCEPETQETVDAIIESIERDRLKELRENAVPTRCDKFFDYYLALVKNNIEPRTWAGYERLVRLHLKPHLGFFELSEVRPVMLTMLYNQMLAKNLTRSVKAAHTLASMVFKEAVKLEVIGSNPATFARAPKIKKSEKVKVLSLDEARRFVHCADDSPYKIIFEFALETGMRPQEYLALRWSDVDLPRGSAEVSRALVYSEDGGYYYKDTKTSSSRRTIPLSPKLVEKLAEHKEKQKKYLADLEEKIRRRSIPSREHRKVRRREVINKHERENLVFASRDGVPFRELNINKRYFKDFAEKAGLDKSLSLYSLRHTCATLLLQTGVNVKVVSERLGHSNINITLETYAHVLPGMGALATDALSAILYKPVKEVASAGQ